MPELEIAAGSPNKIEKMDSANSIISTEPGNLDL